MSGPISATTFRTVSDIGAGVNRTIQFTLAHRSRIHAIAVKGYDTPVPIQQQPIPVVLAGHGLMATARTGAGKAAHPGGEAYSSV